MAGGGAARERLWRTFETAEKAALSLPIVIKEEPLHVAEERIRQPRHTIPVPVVKQNGRKRRASDKAHDADVYLTEFIKVEAIISPRHIQKYLIPVDIPYTEPKSKRPRVQLPDTTGSSNIGKIKMRKITELQRPETFMITPASSFQAKRDSHHDDYSSLSSSQQHQSVSCSCQQCIGSGLSHHNRPAMPLVRYPSLLSYPGPHSSAGSRSQNFWRPFM